MNYKVTVSIPDTKAVVKEAVFNSKLKAELFAMMCEMKGFDCKVKKERC